MNKEIFMKATLTRKTMEASRYGGMVHLLSFKGEDGKSYRSWIDPKNRNFRHWAYVIENVPIGTLLDGLVQKTQTLIDADSRPTPERDFSTGGPQDGEQYVWVLFQHPLINGGRPCKVLQSDLPEWEKLARERSSVNQSA